MEFKKIDDTKFQCFLNEEDLDCLLYTSDAADE